MIKHIGRFKLHDSQKQEWLPDVWSLSLFSYVPAVCSAAQDGVGSLADAVARDAPAYRHWVGRAAPMVLLDGWHCGGKRKQAGHSTLLCKPKPTHHMAYLISKITEFKYHVLLPPRQV